MMLDDGRESIAITFTDQKLSPHAGSASFWSFLRPSGFIEQLKAALPHPAPTSNNSILPLDKALGYTRVGVKPCLHPLLAVLESQNIPYIVVAKLHRPLKTLIIKDLKWSQTALKFAVPKSQRPW